MGVEKKAGAGQKPHTIDEIRSLVTPKKREEMLLLMRRFDQGEIETIRRLIETLEGTIKTSKDPKKSFDIAVGFILRETKGKNEEPLVTIRNILESPQAKEQVYFSMMQKIAVYRISNLQDLISYIDSNLIIPLEEIQHLNQEMQKLSNLDNDEIPQDVEKFLESVKNVVNNHASDSRAKRQFLNAIDGEYLRNAIFSDVISLNKERLLDKNKQLNAKKLDEKSLVSEIQRLDKEISRVQKELWKKNSFEIPTGSMFGELSEETYDEISKRIKEKISTFQKRQEGDLVRLQGERDYAKAQLKEMRGKNVEDDKKIHRNEIAISDLELSLLERQGYSESHPKVIDVMVKRADLLLPGYKQTLKLKQDELQQLQRKYTELEGKTSVPFTQITKFINDTEKALNLEVSPLIRDKEMAFQRLGSLENHIQTLEDQTQVKPSKWTFFLNIFVKQKSVKDYETKLEQLKTLEDKMNAFHANPVVKAWTENVGKLSELRNRIARKQSEVNKAEKDVKNSETMLTSVKSTGAAKEEKAEIKEEKTEEKTPKVSRKFGSS